MNKTNKKGISTIVATVLIVLITVAAVTILWAAISPMLNISDKTSCVSAVTDYEIDTNGEYTKVASASSVNIRIKNNGDVSADNLLLSLSVDGTTFPLTTANSGADGGVTTSPTANGAKIVTVTGLTLTSASNVVASVVPILVIDGEETPCSGGSEVEIANNL